MATKKPSIPRLVGELAAILSTAANELQTGDLATAALLLAQVQQEIDFLVEAYT